MALNKTSFFLFFFFVLTHLNGQLNLQLQQIFENQELMGMSVVKVCQTDIETYHFGLKDYTRELSVDDSTMYRIASISKTVTAMGLMKL